MLDDDLLVLAISIAFLVRHGFARGFHDDEISALAAAWIMPLLSRAIAGLTGIPLGLIVMLALYGLPLRRAIIDRARVCTLLARASRKRDLSCRRVLESCSATLQCGRGFRLFL